MRNSFRANIKNRRTSIDLITVHSDRVFVHSVSDSEEACRKFIEDSGVNFSEKLTFLPPATHTFIWMSGCNKC